ncbi:MAG: hypothetical protein H6626_01795 [Pseudobdellovibrionaceae bacterium]|nr:hypothetical protein [Bdellovibrionales bacterium]USN47850.1 MAG: hypothetical protein H6626_01795 [Pseudobdellovibrionaceae bacterium]
MSAETIQVEKLPAVATNMYYACKKCDADRYHKVIAHVDSERAKIECEVCGSVKTYRVKKTKAGVKKTTTRRRKSKTPADIWAELKETVDVASPMTYDMKQRFEANSAIEHPKFGLGVVTEVQALKIHVTFEDGDRYLVHNRG